MSLRDVTACVIVVITDCYLSADLRVTHCCVVVVVTDYSMLGRVKVTCREF